MANDLRFDNRVVIVTGAGNGLGRSHALLFARAARRWWSTTSAARATAPAKALAAADQVVDGDQGRGRRAVANYDSRRETAAKIVKTALDAFGRIDVVVNNAGILRDGTLPQDDRRGLGSRLNGPRLGGLQGDRRPPGRTCASRATAASS